MKVKKAAKASGSGIVSRGIWLVIVLLACARSYWYVRYQPRAAIPEKPEAVRVAYILHTQGRFADPFDTFPTGPTAHVAPGFPALLAFIYWIFGSGAMGAYIPRLLEATVMVVQVALIPAVAVALGAGRPAGFLAALLAIAGMRHTPIWEASYVGLLLIVATLLACRYVALVQNGRDRKNPYSPWDSPYGVACMMGVLWGVVLLTGPNAGPIWAVWIAGGAWLSRRHGLGYAWLPAAVLPILVIMPWVVRNQEVFHKLIPVRGNFGLELAVANNPCARVAYQENIDTGCFEHPYLRVAEARKMARIGEAEYNSEKMREAETWIRGHLTEALGLWGKRAVYFWFPTLREGRRHLVGSNGRWSALVINLMTVLMLPGLVLLWRTSRAGAVICGIFLGVYPLIYYVVQLIERYRLPIMWVTFILSSVAIQAAALWLWRKLPEGLRAGVRSGLVVV